VTGGGFPDENDECIYYLVIPVVGIIPALICAVVTAPYTGECTFDSDCVVGQTCRPDEEGVRACVEAGPAEALSACAPPSVVVEGACCAPEAAAAGTCGAFRLSECTGGKVRRGEFCQCPEGTTENEQTGACGKPSPVTTKKKVTACKPGFELRGGRCRQTARKSGGCTGGKVTRGEFCQCPEGTTENKRTGKCAKPSPVTTKKKVTACKAGFELRGGRCVRTAKPTAKDRPAGARPSAIGGGGLLDSTPGFGEMRSPVIGGGGPLAPAAGGGGAPQGGGFKPQ
jgi:hypothetical protein